MNVSLLTVFLIASISCFGADRQDRQRLVTSAPPTQYMSDHEPEPQQSSCAECCRCICDWDCEDEGCTRIVGFVAGGSVCVCLCYALTTTCSGK